MPKTITKIPGRIDNLTGVRGFAAIWVVLFHTNEIAHTGPGMGDFISHGNFGVDLFFVLSGFVLSLVYAPNLPPRLTRTWYKTQILRRFAKIYPLHLITLIASIALVVTARHFHYQFQTHRENTLGTAITQVFMLHAFGINRDMSWNVPSWSVSAEWFAYTVLFTPIVFLLRRVRTLYVAVIATMVWAGMLTFCALVLHTPITLTTFGILRITPEFLCGHFLFRLVQNRTSRYGDIYTLLGIALTIVTCNLSNNFTGLLMPALLLLLAGLYFGSKATDAIFGNPFAILIGEASYSIYLMQIFVAIIAAQVLRRSHFVPHDISFFVVTGCIVAGTCAVGLLTFRYLEEPLRQRVLKAFGDKSRNLEASSSHPPLALAPDTQTTATIS